MVEKGANTFLPDSARASILLASVRICCNGGTTEATYARWNRPKRIGTLELRVRVKKADLRTERSVCHHRTRLRSAATETEGERKRYARADFKTIVSAQSMQLKAKKWTEKYERYVRRLPCCALRIGPRVHDCSIPSCGTFHEIVENCTVCTE